MELTTVVAICALSLSGLSFYRSYIYEKQQLDITVTEVSDVTNQGELYMTVAFANGGNRDAALLRVEPALWGHRNKKEAEWIPLTAKVHPDIAVTSPKTPTVIRAGGVEMVTLSAKLDPVDAEHALTVTQDGAFVGIRVATMNSSGNLFLASPSSCPSRDRSARADPECPAGDSPKPQRLCGPRWRAARRHAAIEQENSVRLGRRALLTKVDLSG